MELKAQSFDELYIAIASMAPGFIIIYIRSLFVTGRIPSLREGAFYYILISTIYYSFIYPIYKGIDSTNPLILSAMFFVIPGAIGILLGYMHQSQIIRNKLQRIGLNPIHACPSSWDYIFSKASGYQWIIVTTTDDLKIYGIFGAESFASSEEANRDIYIEQLTDENFTPLPRKHGLWMKESDIKCIEFIPD